MLKFPGYLQTFHVVMTDHVVPGRLQTFPLPVLQFILQRIGQTHSGHPDHRQLSGQRRDD